MDTANTIALASAVLGGGVGAVAVWQARIARRTADLARRQADAADEQVALLRRQLDAETAAAREARGPQFTIKRGWIDRYTDPGRVTVRVYLEQAAGPGLDTVTATATANTLMRHAVNNIAECRFLAVGGSGLLAFELDQNAPERGTINLHLECSAAPGETWERYISHELSTRDPYEPFEHGAMAYPIRPSEEDQ